MIDEQTIKQMLAAGLNYVVDHGFKVKDISVDTGLSVSTIRKLMNQQTEYPRFHTVYVVLAYLGYELEIKLNERRVPKVRDQRVFQQTKAVPLV